MTNSPPKKKLRFGEVLIEKGVVTPDQINIALTEQKRTNELLGKILVRFGFASEAVIRDVVSGAIGQKSIDLSNAVPDSDAIAMIPQDMARRLHVLPLTYDDLRRELSVAMADTFNVVTVDQINTHLGGNAEVVPVMAGEAEIEKAIDQFYGFELSVDGILHEMDTGEIDYHSYELEQDDEYSQPVVRLVNALLNDAVKCSASDVHCEPDEGFLRFRYRIDGVLRQVRSLHKNYWSAISVRLKVMAGMDIAETRSPQDGRISLPLCGRMIDFRVATLPTVHGENIVLRVLDKQKGIVPFEQLGLQDDAIDTLKLMVARPEGMILVTGPTGSGKTTTLYSILNYLNTEEVNIMTLEDPVEYPLTMVRQTSAQEASRLDFASGIRSLMRQDPDIILVGEIRDKDTASMAFRAAMTGHQVFSTLHTNSALGTFPRLIDIGVKENIIAGNMIGVIAQRLVRALCGVCKQPHVLNDLECSLLDLKEVRTPPRVYQGKGCKECNNGYKGRVAFQEILHIDPDIDELIARGVTQSVLLQAALAKGFKPLASIGAQRVLDGTTSLDEVSRVIDLTVKLKH